MTEITRVPLQPITKGSLTRLWIGIVIVVLAAAGVAWAAVPKVRTLAEGVTIETLVEGAGPSPGATDYALVNYRGMLADGTVFDENQQAPMPVDQVVPGFSTALQAMQAGGRYRVQIPAAQGYGAQGSGPGGPIPPNADLTFEVEMIEFRTREEIMQMQQQMMQQQMMQQMMQGGGAPGGVPAPAAPPAGQ